MDYRTKCQMTIGSQMKVILLNKRTIQCREWNIGQFVLFIEELLDMHIGVLVCTERTCNTIYTYTLLEVLNEGAEITH